MRKRNYFFKALTAMLFGLTFGSAVQALPSLDPQNWDTLKVDEKIGRSTDETVITVIRDSSKPLVWYYVPNRPRLAERITIKDDKKVAKPVFQLMTLQTKSKSNIYEEGLLQFSLRMDLQPETASQAKNLIFKKMEKDGLAKEYGDIRLLPLPVSSASISIYKPSGEWLSGGVQQPAIAPIFSTQAVPFQVNLTSMGADAMKALTQKGQGGLGVYYELSFEGVLPPAKLTVEIDWDQTFEHFSENTKKKHYWNALLFAGGTKTSNVASITENLVENKCIKITTEGREDELEALQAVLDPIMERINTELIEKMAPPEKVDPAEAKDPSYGIGMFYGGGSSYAMKSKKVVKKGKERISFDRAKIITRATSCGTFIGIGNYDKEIIDEANIVMEPGNWEKAYYTIPAVGDDPNLLSITLNQFVQYKAAAKKPEGELPKFSGCENPQLITWKPDAGNGQSGWVNKNGDIVSNLSWPLQALYSEAKKAGKDINDYAEYKIDIVISSRGKGALVDEVKLSKTLPMMTGDKPVTNPMAIVDTLTASCDYLTFGKSEGLKKMLVQVERKSADGKKRLDRYNWSFDYSAWDKGNTVHSWYIPKEGDFQYIPRVTFQLHKANSEGKRAVDWEYNGKDLLGPDGYGYLEIDPGDEAWDPIGEFY